MDPGTIGIWTLAGFAAGAIPFSALIARRCAGADISGIGDGNPGAANAWRAGGWRAGAPALALDFLKGALPVVLARDVGGVNGGALVPVALAPVLGHAFSPFLRGRGGKALAVTFGIWCGLTLYEAPLVLGLFMLIFFFGQTVDAWGAVLGMLGLGGYLIARQAQVFLLAVWLGNLIILVWKHRVELRQPMQLSPRLAKSLRRER
jgi:glycerol-3-phosphate acyltransferase PlsY